MQKEDFLSKNIVLILLSLFLLALIFLIVTGLFYNNTFGGSISSNHEIWGTFGYFFGGTLNPIFSLLALIALLLTIVLQNRELKQTRKEFEKSSSALEEQSESIRIQNFENTFFKLISLHNEIVDSLVYNISQVKRRCFKEYIRFLELSPLDKSNDDKTKKTPASLSYNLNYEKVAHSVEHYHKNLYQILSFVHKNKISLVKKQYTNLIRSQLSRDELHMLFLHGLSKFGHEKFKPLIEEYEMLEHLPRDTFLIQENMYLYDVKAFGKNKELQKLHEESSALSKYGSAEDVMKLNND